MSHNVEQLRRELLGDSWYERVKGEFEKDYMKNLSQILSNEYYSWTIYPERKDIFRAFKLTPFEKVKVVVLGQDPYYNGRANGLAFGYSDGILGNFKKQSLEVIFDEIERDIRFGLYLEGNATLEQWAEQGVLMLNTVLTVRKNSADSHSRIGWQNFTSYVMTMLMIQSRPLVVMCWGSKAKTFISTIPNPKSHLVLYAPHPAADLYRSNEFGDIKPNFPYTFAGCNHFSKCNEYLGSKGTEKINW